jgi:hypothetical protein
VIYNGVIQRQNAAKEVAKLVDKKWTKKTDSYAYINEKIITVRFKYRGNI